jgi:hypothetical protein
MPDIAQIDRPICIAAIGRFSRDLATCPVFLISPGVKSSTLISTATVNY